MFSCEFYEISKNTYSYRTPLLADSGFIKKETPFLVFPKDLLKPFQNSFFTTEWISLIVL